jgi:predicted homoserine dehydrogenase-like protein
VVATAKRDLSPGELLDGEGGCTVWGRLMPARQSLQLGGLPLGLAQQLKVVRPVALDQPLVWDDVELDPTQRALALRREMESLCAPDAAAATRREP